MCVESQAINNNKLVAQYTVTRVDVAEEAELHMSWSIAACQSIRDRSTFQQIHNLKSVSTYYSCDTRHLSYYFPASSC